MSKRVKRLFKEFVPENYNLWLNPDKQKMTFSGVVTITGKKVGRPSKRLTFHQKELKITSAVVIKHDKNTKHPVDIDRINHHASFDEVRLHSPGMLYPGKYTIELKFEGKITENMNGMYPCKFEHEGKEEVVIATQFESHHAREVFPCIDEPEAKSTFDLTLSSPDSEEVIANTPVKDQAKENGQLVTTFETTPVMSTYLLAFAYGKVKFKEAKTKKGVSIRAFATPDKIDQVDFALGVATKCLDFYDDYFDIDYPLEKSDMIALPDFASGAMENWGLVTYREQCMLVDPENTSIGTKQYVAMVVAHELAHQWFGNLVTMRWWTDLWLNEGFASWIEYLAIDHLFPDWQMWTQFIADEQQIAMKLDGLEHTHPVEVPVKHPDEIRTIFDTISYSKGASVIHMLNDYLGAEIFRDGLRHYLKEFAYKNTDTVDLWGALEKVSGKPVKNFMHAWTAKEGFPVVEAKINESGLELSQQRFYLGKPDSATHHHWPVPLLSNNDLGIEIFDKAKIKIDSNLTSKDLQLNTNRSGFYRVVYDSAHLEELSKSISELPVLSRLGLLADTFESSKAGYTSTVTALNLITRNTNEANSAVWDVMSSVIYDTRSVMMSDEKNRILMHPLMDKLSSSQVKRLGWQPKKDEPYFDTLLRPTVLGMSAGSDNNETLAKIKELYEGMNSPSDVQSDIRSLVLNTIARKGDRTDFERMISWHNEETNSEVRTSLAAAITGYKQKSLIEKSLEMITTKDVRKQDVGYWVAYALMNRYGKDLAWQWMKDNWKWLEKNLGSDLSFSRFPVYAARSFIGKEYLEDFVKFFEPKRSPALERSINQGIEIIKWRNDWHERDQKSVIEFFKQHQ